jgi:hypothetical protein
MALFNSLVNLGDQLIVKDNRALSGGGILVGEIALQIGVDSFWSSNTASSSGIHNGEDSDGGGLFVTSSSHVAIGRNCTFSGNVAARLGGGLAVASSSTVAFDG